jgi:protein transport protein SEC24
MAIMTQKSLPVVRQSLIDKCTRILLMYRRNCSSGMPIGQLVLPEGFKLLPLYTLALLKSKPLKGELSTI